MSEQRREHERLRAVDRAFDPAQGRAGRVGVVLVVAVVGLIVSEPGALSLGDGR